MVSVPPPLPGILGCVASPDEGGELLQLTRQLVPISGNINDFCSVSARLLSAAEDIKAGGLCCKDIHDNPLKP